jgi:RimJ/RimL family protein N-acetyltransferase
VATARLSEVIARWANLDDEGRYWLGVPSDPALPETTEFCADPYVAGSGLEEFVARERRTDRIVADISLAYNDGRFYVGGNVAAGHRRQGYGSEALNVVCAIAHRHLGITELNAGCEVSNVASWRWLASCGFAPAPGPPQQTLANGRVVESCWWRHVDRASRLRCRDEARRRWLD